jgi:outer membrane protein assembly factor BamB
MKTNRRFPGWLLLGLLAPSLFAASAKELWTQKLPGAAKWHQTTSVGTLLVGTDDVLLSVNPEDGKVMWTRNEFRKTTPHNVREVEGTPVLLANNFSGMMDSKARTSAVDILTGEVLWTGPEYVGQYLGTYPVAAQGLALVLVNGYDKETGTGCYVHALDLKTGTEKWKVKYGEKAIALHVADSSGTFSPRMDLSGHYDPVIEGTRVYLPFLGVHCLDLATGQFVWQVPFQNHEAGLKRACAPLRCEGDRIYAAGGGLAYAIDKASGNIVWQSEHISKYAGLFKARDNGIFSQIEPMGDRVFVRVGGNFSDGKQYHLREPLAVLALDKTTGKTIWNYTKIDAGLTNLLPLPALGAIMVAGGETFVGLDATGAEPTPKFTTKLEFKRKMGGVEMAAKGAKIGFGALSGGIVGGLKGAVSAAKADKARLDVPVSLSQQADGTVTVRGQQHIAGFDPAKNTLTWSNYFAPPGVNNLAVVAMGAVSIALAVANTGQAAMASSTSDHNRAVDGAIGSTDSFGKYAARRFSATRAAGNSVYMLTNIEEGKQKGPGILKVDLATGEPTGQLLLNDKEPKYSVDEAVGRVFYFKGKDAIVAYQF